MSGFSFLAPGFLAGLAAISIPIIIHLINRRRAIKWRFAAMEFLLRSHRRVARRLQIKRLLLLLLRCLMISFIAFAFAKPFLKRVQGGNKAQGIAAKAVVLILDDSMSMAYRENPKGPTLFAQAKTRVQRLLRRFRGEDKVALLRGSRSRTPIPGEQRELIFDKQIVANKLKAWRVSYRETDLSHAMQRAAAMLRQVRGRQPTIMLVSDFAQHAFEAAKVPTLSKFARIELIPIRPRRAPANLAITKLVTEPAPFAAPDAYRFTATVRNFSNKTAKSLPITLYLGDKARTRSLLNVGPFRQVNKSFVLRLPRAGTYTGRVQIAKDGLTADNRFYFSMQARRRPRVLLVNGDPRTTPYLDELFYAEKSLRDEGNLFTVRTVLASAPLPPPERFDVVYLVNVPQLPDAWVAKLTTFVNKGGGLLIACGEQINTTDYNQKLGALLPRPLRHIALAAQSPDGTGVALQRSFGQIKTNHPIFLRLYQDGILFRSARVSKLMLVEPSNKQSQSQILWRYSHGPPALLERQVGQGRVLLWTNTLDRDWNDLPIRPYYVPLLRQLTVYLAGGAHFQQSPSRMIGQKVMLPIKGTTPVTVRTPDKKRSTMRPTSNGYLFPGGQTPGIYRFYREGLALPALPQVVNTSPAESNLTPLDDARLRNIGTLSARGGGFLRRQSERLWPFFLLCVLLFFFAEGLIIRYM